MLLTRGAWEGLMETCGGTVMVMKRGTVWFVLSTWSQGEVSYRLPVSSGGREHTHERKDGWWRAERTFEETPLLREAALEKKSIPSLQRKKFMKLEHKRSHVQLAARNLRGEAGEEVGGDEVIKTSEEANKACRWSMIPASRYSRLHATPTPRLVAARFARDTLCWRARPVCLPQIRLQFMDTLKYDLNT